MPAVPGAKIAEIEAFLAEAEDQNWQLGSTTFQAYALVYEFKGNLKQARAKALRKSKTEKEVSGFWISVYHELMLDHVSLLKAYEQAVLRVGKSGTKR